MHDSRSQDREWFIGQRVMVRNLRSGFDWVPGVIVERLGPVSYLVETEGQKLWKRHVDQLKKIKDSPIQQPHRSNEFELDAR